VLQFWPFQTSRSPKSARDYEALGLINEQLWLGRSNFGQGPA
jgi:hypothetical protein